MYPSEWAGRRIELLAHSHAVVWVEDPYCLLASAEVETLRTRLLIPRHSVVAVRDAWHLRCELNQRDPANSRLVLIDQSYAPRDPNQLPKDAKPGDLAPLPAPDWKPFLPQEALFRPTIRDFLVDVTDDPRWPANVNIFPYQELATTDPEGFVRTFDTFRQWGRLLTDDDLVMVGASAFFQVDLLDLTDPLLALELAFHSEEKWQRLSAFFNPGEVDSIRKRLQSLAPPIGHLFGPNPDTARLALIALLVLSQHFDQPARHLPVLSPALAPYAGCPPALVAEVPSWFPQEEIPLFERLVTSNFLNYLHTTLQLDAADNACQFAQRERFSSKLRSLVSHAIPSTGTRPTSGPAGLDFSIDRLMPQFRDLKQTLANLVTKAESSVKSLHLTALRELTAAKVLQVFDHVGIHKIDSLLGGLSGLIRDIEGPAHRQWQGIAGFPERWAKDLQDCQNLMTEAGRLRDDLDREFGKLLEARYPEIVPAQMLTTRLFYHRFIAPRRRDSSGNLHKALILVIDSMRLDVWRQLIRPALEQDYIIQEDLAFSELPSVTRVSRSSFFAGLPPGALPKSVRETDLFAELLTRTHGAPQSFEAILKRPGMTYLVRSKDRNTTTGVFDFADALSHQVDWDLQTLQEAIRPFVREIRAILEEAGPETLVFITTDHGHFRRESGSPVFLENATDVGYRSACVPSRVEGEKGRRLFQIPARILGHSDKGWYVFPRPGCHLRSLDLEHGAGRPGAAWRHGGISMPEAVIPLAFLKHRSAPSQIAITVSTRDKLVATQTAHLTVSITADGIVTSPIRIQADTNEVEPVIFSEASSTPSTQTMRYTPASPGRRKLRFKAWLADQVVATADLEVEVAPAPVPEDQTKAKLRKLFGED